MLNIDLQKALMQVRDWAGGPDAIMNLSDTGNLFAKAGVKIQDYGYRKLTDLLRSIPTFCEIHGDRVRFLNGSPIPDDSPMAPKSHLQLQADLWKAMVIDRPDIAFFVDMETQKIIEVPLIQGTPGPPVSDDDIRYLRVPSMPYFERLKSSRLFFHERLPADVLDEIFSQGGWFRKLKEKATPVDLQLFKHETLLEVLPIVQQWLKAHDLNEERFIFRQFSSIQPINDKNTNISDIPISFENQLRRRLHQVLEQMTLQEMLELRIPARFSLQTSENFKSPLDAPPSTKD